MPLFLAFGTAFVSLFPQMPDYEHKQAVYTFPLVSRLCVYPPLLQGLAELGPHGARPLDARAAQDSGGCLQHVVTARLCSLLIVG